MPMFRYVPLYLNDTLWKYVMADMNAIQVQMSVMCIPFQVSQEARQYEKTKKMLKDWGDMVIFTRKAIPVHPGLNEVRYYGVHSCLRVLDGVQGFLKYDVPYDPEDNYYARHRKT